MNAARSTRAITSRGTAAPAAELSDPQGAIFRLRQPGALACFSALRARSEAGGNGAAQRRVEPRVRSSGSGTPCRAHHPAGFMLERRSPARPCEDVGSAAPFRLAAAWAVLPPYVPCAYVGRPRRAGNSPVPLCAYRFTADCRQAWRATFEEGPAVTISAACARCAVRDRSGNACLAACHVPIWSEEKRVRGAHHEMRSHPMAASLSFRPSEAPAQRRYFCKPSAVCSGLTRARN